MVYGEVVKSVEHTLPVWARRIAVEPIVFRGRPFLKVTGTGVFHETIPKNENDSDVDLLGRFLDARRRRDVRSAPHIEFSNARTDDELVAFISRYGPIWSEHTIPTPSKDASDDELSPYEEETVTRLQSLEQARRDQAVFSDLVRLVAALAPEGSKKPRRAARNEKLEELLMGPEEGPLLKALRHCASSLVSSGKSIGLKHWSGSASSLVSAGTVALSRSEVTLRLAREAHETICDYLNRNIFHLVPFFDSTAKVWRTALLPNVSSHGIRPALYLMLREDYARGRQLGICGRQKCASAFLVKRLGQRYCCDDCSRKQRQKDYYQRKGKFTRRKRQRLARGVSRRLHRIRSRLLRMKMRSP
jgi:hypothetical protein